MSNPNFDVNPAQWSFRGNSSDITTAINEITSRLSGDRGIVINGYSATTLVVEKFLANSSVSNDQLIKISKSTLDKFSPDDSSSPSSVPKKYPYYETMPGHVMAVDAFCILTGNPKDQVSTKLNGLGFTGTPDILITSADDNPPLQLGTIFHDLTNYFNDSGVVGLDKSIWGVAGKAASALVMYAGTLVTDFIPSEEEIFNVMGTRQLPTREMELRQTVTKLGKVSSTIATKLAMHYGSEQLASQIITTSAAKTLGGWLGDKLAYQLESVGSSIPARALYTRLYGNFTNTLLGFGSSAISQAFSEKFDINDPLAEIAIDLVTQSLTNHIFSELTVSAFGKPFAVDYLGLDPLVNYSLSKSSVIGEVVRDGYPALQSFAVTLLFKYLDEAWEGADLNNFGASIGGAIGSLAGPIGSFLGSVIGGWTWDLLFGKTPRAYYSVQYDAASVKFINQFSLEADGGKTEVAQRMGQSVADTLQLIAAMIGGTPLSITAATYGHYEKDFVFDIGGTGRNSFSNIQTALDTGVIRQFKTLNIQGGDPYVKRLIVLPSYNPDIKGLFADLGIAKEYSVHKVDPVLYGQAVLNVDNADARRYLLDDWRRVQARAKQLTLDTLPENDGSEFIVGTTGNDAIDAGIGNDMVFSDRGIDYVDGGEGNDLLVIDYSTNLYAGTNSLPAGIRAYANTSNYPNYLSTYYTSGGNTPYDYLAYKNIEQFQITGTIAADNIITGDGNDTINGGAGNDTINAGAGNDLINGGDGNDSINAGGGIDIVNSGTGDDTIANISDDDIIDGGAGIDTLTDVNYGTATSDITLNELGSSAPLLGTNIRNAERFGSIILGSGNDTVDFSSRFDNTINTGKGNDTINGGLGIDYVDGGEGNDLLVIDYSTNLYAGTNSLPAGIRAYANTSNYPNYLSTYYTSGGNTPYDYLAYKNIEQFQITGTIAADNIITGDGNDTINGGAGNDAINAGAGNDLISGVSPISINPGRGEVDSLTGGAGRDRFVLSDANWIGYDDGDTNLPGNGDYALVIDFAPSNDIIQLRGSSTAYLLTVSEGHTKIYIDKPGGEPDELIASLQNCTGLSLTSNYFDYIPLPIITLAVFPASVPEDGTSNFIYTFVRTGSTTNALTVNYTVAGTATLGIDYTGIAATPETKTVSFAAGSDIAIVTVDPTADAGNEADETVTLSIATCSGYSISTTTAVVGMILNDDPFINPPGLRRLEIWPGNSSGNPSGFMPAADRLYFSGNDGSHGEELWWSDGSSTFRTGVKSNTLLPKSASSLYANIANDDPALLGNSLFFSAYSASNGWALWRYDGTAASLVKDFLPNGYDLPDFSTSWSPYDLTTVGEKLFFSAPILRQVDGNGDGVFEQEFLDPYLWYSDGTAAGTLPLAYLPSGTREKYVVGNLLYFTAFNAAGDFLLWRSDGTPSGTIPLKAFPPYGPLTWAQAGNRLFYEGIESITDPRGAELWTSDGSAAGTVLVKDIAPGPDGSQFAGRSRVNWAAIGNTLYFTADDGSSGMELWKSDGSATGTVRVADINPGAGGSNPSWLQAVGDTLFFSASSPGGLSSFGNKLWKSDGTTAGTVPVADASSWGPPLSPEWLTAVGNTLYFTAINTPDGTTPWLGRELWKSDGTAAGTIPVADINPGGGSSWIEWPTLVGDTLFFRATDANYDTELWALDVSADLPAYTNLESQGNTQLLRRRDGMAFVKSGSRTRQEITSPWNSTAGDNSSEWQMLAADTIGGINKILWRNNTSNFLHIWSLDANWNWQSASGADGFNTAKAWELETSFQVDATRDGITGAPYTSIEAQGNTKLLRRANGKAFVEYGTGTQKEITSPWNSTAGSDSSEWQMLAADTIGGINKILWRNNTSNFLHIWSLDANWNLQSSSGADGFNTAKAWELETSFQVDATRDGITGAPFTTIEAQGNTQLLRRANGKAFVEVGGTRQEITSPWGSPAGDDSSEWQMLAAETISGVNTILWRNNTFSFLHIWNLDANWTLQSTSGADGFNTPRALELETSFQVDATRDGIVGSPFTTIEAQGNTKLLKRGDGKAFVEVGGARQEITSPWGNTAGSDSSEWQMLAADTISGVNTILWRNNTSSFLHIWNLDANWTLQSTSGADGFNTPRALELETSFQVDATRDGIVGSPFTTIEAQGNTKLLKRGDGKAFVEVGGARQEITSPWGSPAGDNSSEWQMLAADTISGTNQILWRNNTSSFLHIWNLDPNWNLQSSSGSDAFNTPRAWELETSFRVDATRDGIIGTPFITI